MNILFKKFKNFGNIINILKNRFQIKNKSKNKNKINFLKKYNKQQNYQFKINNFFKILVIKINLKFKKYFIKMAHIIKVS